MSASAPIGLPAPSAIEPISQAVEARANATYRASMSKETGGALENDDTTVVVVDYGKPAIRQREWGLAARTDPSVTFEEYVYWAREERELELRENEQYVEERGPWTVGRMIRDRFSKGVRRESENDKKRDERLPARGVDGDGIVPGLSEKDSRERDGIVVADADAADATAAAPVGDDRMRVTDEEWRTAARALRTASWGTVFFLVTTDILGWSGTPYVFASVGFGPGVSLYIIFWLAAAYAAWGIWKTFLGLDSSRFPMLSFGDPFLRVYGPWARHGINIAQSIQQFLSVAVILLSNGIIISQISKENICFVVCILIVMIVGVIFGSIRSLQRLGWLCNLSVWVNIINFIVIMVAAAHFPPDYEAVFSSTLIKTKEPVRTFAGPPPAQYQQQVTGFASQFNAVNQMVYAYSGALLFVAFMAEMRHPMDFWKGCLMAQAFICFVYILFGVFVYAFYGQYAISNINQVVEPFGLQTAGNVLSLLTAWFACFLYFNIGMKTVYLEVFQEIFHFPPIITRKGRWCWYLLGPLYWILAFIVAAAVPNFTGIVSFVGGLFSLNFTYSFPIILFLGFKVQKDAALPGEGFDPVTGVTTRHDRGAKRWLRGYMKSPLHNTFSLLYIMAALASSGMGTWAAIEGLISIFGPGGTVATHFGCAAPV